MASDVCGGGVFVPAGEIEDVEMEIVPQGEEPVVVQRARVLATNSLDGAEEKVDLESEHKDLKSKFTNPEISCKKRSLAGDLMDGSSHNLLKLNPSGSSGVTTAEKKPFLLLHNDKLLKNVADVDRMHLNVHGTSEKEGLNLHSTLGSQVLPDSNALRISYPAREVENDNKRPARICSYFAQGWCRNGNSCKFLHHKHKECSDTDKSANKEQAGQHVPVVYATHTGGSQLGKLSNLKELFMLNYQGSSNNEVHQRALIHAYGGGNVRFPHLNEGKPQFDVPKGKSLSNSHASHGLYNLTGVTNPGFDCSVHSLGGPHYRATPRLGMPSPNWSTPRLGMPLPNWSTPHLGMPSPNWSTPSFDNPSLHDYVDFGKDCNTSRSGSFVGSSLHHSRSSIGGRNNQPFVMSSGHLPRMEDKVWETSAPFRRSFSFPECNAPPRSQFGPPVDRFDPPKIGTHKSQMAVSHTTSTGYKNENAIIYGSTISCNTEKSLDCDGKLGKSVSGKESNEIASLMASSGGQNSSLDSENQVTHMEPGEIKNNAALKKDQDVKGQSGHKKIKSDFHFRLVAFVKEAVKPFWKAGKLSKDAHNYIVKKTVDKILASLKPHEIPATEELMNDYMIKHEQEIKNLVKVYVDQDGKFQVSDYYVSKLTA